MLLRKKIMIRRCENFMNLDSSFYRIGIKTHNENLLLLKAIKEQLHG
jgi:threonine-phosphate decarboxylase